jgi:hypothetical protein
VPRKKTDRELAVGGRDWELGIRTDDGFRVDLITAKGGLCSVFVLFAEVLREGRCVSERCTAEHPTAAPDDGAHRASSA